jgi:cholesterol transport system auxiliary component
VRTLVRLAALPAALSLSGCAGLLHSTAPPEQTYYLRPPVAAPGGAAAAGGIAASAVVGGASLRVGHPLAAPGLDSSHIMLIEADHRMNLYAGSRWPAPVADVIEALALQTLRASGDWTSVEDSTSPFASDYLLQVAVRRFEADYTGGGSVPEVHVTLDCILGRREGRDVVASFVASGTALASANRQSSVVSAFEQAAGIALTSLSQQAAQAVRSAPAAASASAVSK